MVWRGQLEIGEKFTELVTSMSPQRVRRLGNHKPHITKQDTDLQMVVEAIHGSAQALEHANKSGILQRPSNKTETDHSTEDSLLLEKCSAGQRTIPLTSKVSGLEWLTYLVLV